MGGTIFRESRSQIVLDEWQCDRATHQIRHTGGSRVETQASEVGTWEGTVTDNESRQGREPEDATATVLPCDADTPAH